MSKRNIKKIADLLLKKENDTHSETIYFLFLSMVLHMNDTKIVVSIQIIKCRESTHSTRHITPLKKKNRHITMTEISVEHINISIIYPQNILYYWIKTTSTNHHIIQLHTCEIFTIDMSITILALKF